jgi:hypothetical protein
MKQRFLITGFFLLCLVVMVSCKKKQDAQTGTIKINSVTVGNLTLQTAVSTKDVPVDTAFCLNFSGAVDTASARAGITIKRSDQVLCMFGITFSNAYHTVWLKPLAPLSVLTGYSLTISQKVRGAGGESFSGETYSFTTVNGRMVIGQITLNGTNFSLPNIPRNINRKSTTVEVRFSEAIDTNGYATQFYLSGNIALNFSLSQDHKTVTVQNKTDLADITQYFFRISSSLKAANGYSFGGFSNSFYTDLDSTLKFPLLTDDQLLTLIQEKTFRYFYDFAHPSCGLARERNTSGDIVTIGGSGFGVMALIVGMERGFITRDQGLTRIATILNFLETCDRFHGAWPHWLNGMTGKTVPFTPNDNGADLVETSYMVEGLITMRQYLNPSAPAEQSLITRIDALTDAVEYDWFTRGQNVLYWHWSPNLGWIMNMQIRGYNETLITYIVSATSNTHPITAAVYTQGYARNGGIKNGNSYYGYRLPLGEAYGGPLFFIHFSFLGLDPRTLQDQYANYWEQGVNQSLINWTYCFTNPKHFLLYSRACWGLTASDNPWGYDPQSPTNDLGVITPTAAVSSLPYTPVQSLNAIRFFYYTLGDHLWGDYGFYDAFDPTEGWWASSYLAIDQGPIICMIENYRSGLLWNLFMSSPKVNTGLITLGFTHK